MPVKCFFDTNVLLYLYSDEPLKRTAAIKAFDSGRACISIPILNEFSRVLLEKKQFGLPFDRVSAAVNQLQEFMEILPVNHKVLSQALKIGERYRYSHFDSFHLATALENGCDLFFSEDMQSGQIIDGRLGIINPFNDDL